MLADKRSVLKPHIMKLLDIATSAANPDVENQVADVIICILEIIAVFPKFKDMLNGNKIFYEKLGKMSAHCGLFELHNTETNVTIDQIDVCGEIRLSQIDVCGEIRLYQIDVCGEIRLYQIDVCGEIRLYQKMCVARLDCPK